MILTPKNMFDYFRHQLFT